MDPYRPTGVHSPHAPDSQHTNITGDGRHERQALEFPIIPASVIFFFSLFYLFIFIFQCKTPKPDLAVFCVPIMSLSGWGLSLSRTQLITPFLFGTDWSIPNEAK